MEKIRIKKKGSKIIPLTHDSGKIIPFTVDGLEIERYSESKDKTDSEEEGKC